MCLHLNRVMAEEDVVPVPGAFHLVPSATQPAVAVAITTPLPPPMTGFVCVNGHLNISSFSHCLAVGSLVALARTPNAVVQLIFVCHHHSLNQPQKRGIFWENSRPAAALESVSHGGRERGRFQATLLSLAFPLALSDLSSPGCARHWLHFRGVMYFCGCLFQFQVSV